MLGYYITNIGFIRTVESLYEKNGLYWRMALIEGRSNYCDHVKGEFINNIIYIFQENMLTNANLVGFFYNLLHAS